MLSRTFNVTAFARRRERLLDQCVTTEPRWRFDETGGPGLCDDTMCWEYDGGWLRRTLSQGDTYGREGNSFCLRPARLTRTGQF